MAAAIGIPTIALGSVPSKTLAMSPIRFVAIKPTASQCPHLKPRQSPNDALAHNSETIANNKTAHRPNLERFSSARGLRRHIDWRKLLGRSKDKLAVRLITAPAKKKILSAVIPRRRWTVVEVLLFWSIRTIIRHNLSHIFKRPTPDSVFGA